MLYSVCSMRKDVLVTRCLPSVSQPARTHVTHVGSPANSALYSGVRRCLQGGQGPGISAEIGRDWQSTE